MRPRTHRGLAAATLAVLLGVTAMQVVAEEPQDTPPVDPSVKAIEAWHKTCEKCHATPDTQFETDRAFLRQITETT